MEAETGLPLRKKSMTKVLRVADFILITLATLCAGGLFYFLYYYAWRGEREFESWLGVLVYYVLPALTASLLFASLRLRPAHRINLALLLSTTGLSLFVLEACLTIWSSLPSVQEAQTRNVRAAIAGPLGVKFDTRSKLEVVRDLQSRGVDAVPSFDRPFLGSEEQGRWRTVLAAKGQPILPLGSAANREVVLCNEFGTYVTYRSDRHGFNNPDDVWDRSSVDILAVGDSFVQGWCVPVDSSFVSVIRDRHHATLNLGMEGNGPLVMLAAMKEYGPVVRPKVVLWFFFEGNDLVDLQKEVKSPLLRRYLGDGFTQSLHARQAEIDHVLSDYLNNIQGRSGRSVKMAEIRNELSLLLTEPRRLRNRLYRTVRFSELRDRLGLIRGSSSSRNEAVEARATSPQVMDLFAEIVLDAARSARSWGAEVYFVYLPAATRYSGHGVVAAADRERVLEAAKAADLPLIDMVQSFAKVENPMSLFPYGGFGHYTEEGHRLVAETVLEQVSIRP
jgi:hypothetical protein